MNGNEPIMPLVGVDKSKDLFPHNTNGLTKREYFAAKAMQGMAASQFWSENFTDNTEYLEKAMKVAVLSADVLIAELNKTAKP